MAQATVKHPRVESVISHILNPEHKESDKPPRIEAIEADRCVQPPVGCGQPAVGFRDALSKREYTISGLCQACQDRVFGQPERGPADEQEGEKRLTGLVGRGSLLEDRRLDRFHPGGELDPTAST